MELMATAVAGMHVNKQLVRQVSESMLGKIILVQSCFKNHHHLYNKVLLNIGGAGGKMVGIGTGVASLSPIWNKFLMAPLSLLLENLRGVIPGYTEKCAGRWDYE